MVNVIIDQPDCDFYIKHYQDGQLTLNTGEQIQESMLYFVDQVPQAWPITDIAGLSQLHFQPIIDYQPEVMILGTGERQIFPGMERLLPLQSQGIGVEIMHNIAACQTFNLLADEGRKVLLALIVNP